MLTDIEKFKKELDELENKYRVELVVEDKTKHLTWNCPCIAVLDKDGRIFYLEDLTEE